MSLENCRPNDETRLVYQDLNEKILNGILKKKVFFVFWSKYTRRNGCLIRLIYFKNIEAAKSLTQKALDKIKNDLEYTNNRFHAELYRIRQYWKVKKLANKFIGDLSYRSSKWNNKKWGF